MSDELEATEHWAGKSVWKLVDFTNGKNGGFFRIERDGSRVCDAFPYARGADPAWIKEQCELIVRQMNDAELPSIARVLGNDARRALDGEKG